MKPIQLAVTVGFVLFAIAVVSGSVGESVEMFTVLFTVLTIAAVADPATQEPPRTGAERPIRHSGAPRTSPAHQYRPCRRP